MIIDFRHSFKDYDEILNFYGIWEYQCPKCGARHSLHRHAKYGRHLVFCEEGHLSETQGIILRLLCRSCKSTHAVLSMDMIPFFSYSLPAFLNIMGLCFAADGSVLKTEQETGISYQLLYRMLLIFHQYYRHICLLLRREGLWVHSAQPFPRQAVQLLSGNSPPLMQSSFFRSFGFPVFLNRRSTVSFPLVFGASFS